MIARIFVVTAVALGLVACGKSTEPNSGEATANTLAATTLAPGATPAAAKTDGWTTTPSGLKYKVLKKGTGTLSPKPTDTVNVHYHGTLLNGTVFDSSVQRGEPISFGLSAVIKGWTEGLQLMKVGDKFKFEIPPDLAYGAGSPSRKIPPSSTLVFEVELLGIR